MIAHDYKMLKLECGKAFFRKDRIEDISSVDAIVFDCDGVLIDIRDSYNRVISKTVAYVLDSLIGSVISEELFSEKVLFFFRDSGGFNNDWDICYGILMFIFCDLPEKDRVLIEAIVDEVVKKKDPYTRFFLARKLARKKTNPSTIVEHIYTDFVDKLKQFTESLDPSGVDSVDKRLICHFGVQNEYVQKLRTFLYDPPEVGKSIIATLFEEMFDGTKLFKETWGLEPIFYDGPGLVEKEKSIIQAETLKQLQIIMGNQNLGIASGSKLKPAEYVLSDLLRYFKEEALVFVDSVEAVQKEHMDKGMKVNLRKPHPFSLLRSTETMNPFRFALYVGDSMEDAITVTKSRETDMRFLFAGVYRYSSIEKDLQESFLKYGCDLILPSVNDLPFVLETIRSEENESRRNIQKNK